MSTRTKSAKTSDTSDVSHKRHTNDLDALENTNSAIAQRVMLDIELRCKDGSFQASSVYLATNSVVFHRMFFSEMPMAESLTNIVHLDDILMADMELMIKFCQVNKHYEDLAKDLSKESTLSSIHVAHRFEFTLALEILSLRYAEVVPVPTPQDLQFADRLELNYILNRWSLNCESTGYFHSFVVQLADFPLSSNTLKLFADVHQSSIKSDTNPPLKIVDAFSQNVTWNHVQLSGMKTDQLRGGFTLFENHPLNRSGSYTISFTTTDCHVQAGFGYAVFPITAATFGTMSNIDCQARTILIGYGTHVSLMSRSMGADCTLTLIYNPAAGTIHGAYNREPEILLRKDIPVGETPHRPYINMTSGGDGNPKVTLVPNPRAGL